MKQPIDIDVQDIDHLGLIASIVDEIGIVDIINRLLGTHPLEEVSAGHIVKALILNCLGFLTAPLYLFSQFFEGKATEHLIGPGVHPEKLNDSRIGRVLDQLYQQGLTHVFVEIALAAVKRFEVKTKQVHLDGSSFCVHGEYLNVQPETSSVEISPLEQSHSPENSVIAEADNLADPVPIQITYGYSRDHRPDLKQFTLSLMTSGDGDVPLYLRVGNGNDADKAVFTEVVAQFQQEWKATEPDVYVADAALYSEENIDALGETPWISRVPGTVGEVKQLIQSLPPEMFISSSLENYSIAEVCSTYAGICQRWLVVQSEARKQADLKQLDKRITNTETEKIKALTRLGANPFVCEADALKAVQTFTKKLKYHRLTDIEVHKKPQYDKPGRPRTGDVPKGYTYHIQATLALKESAVENQRNQAGRFILATNLLDDRQWTNDMVLQEYKNQQSCERGFRFLKDPLFFAARVFIKSPQRVAALAMVMGLCLLVYSIGQRQLRLALDEASETIPGACHFLERKIRLFAFTLEGKLMTEQERKELKQCSRRIAELLYQEACESKRPVSNLGAIESTVRTQMQEYVTPTIGEFFVNPSVRHTKDILE